MKKIFVIFLTIATLCTCLTGCTSKEEKANSQKLQCAANNCAEKALSITDEAVRINNIKAGELITIYIDPAYDGRSVFDVVTTTTVVNGKCDERDNELLAKLFVDHYHAYAPEETDACIIEMYATYKGEKIVVVTQDTIDYRSNP